MIKNYSERPGQIKAIQYFYSDASNNSVEVMEFGGAVFQGGQLLKPGVIFSNKKIINGNAIGKNHLTLNTPRGHQIINVNDYVIQNGAGYTVMNPKEFEVKYQEVFVASSISQKSVLYGKAQG